MSKGPSDIWKYFENPKHTSKYAICKLCKINCTRAGNTSNLWSHLKNNHRLEYLNLSKDKDSKGRKNFLRVLRNLIKSR